MPSEPSVALADSSQPSTSPLQPLGEAPDVTEPRCPNCEAVATDAFCPKCGQKQGPLQEPVSAVVLEAMDQFLNLDAKLGRTLWPLLVRPGFLTTEYFAGRRERYVRPFKLFIAVGVVMFTVLGLTAKRRLAFSVASMKRVNADLGVKGARDTRGLDNLIRTAVSGAPEPLRSRLEAFTAGGYVATMRRVSETNRRWSQQVNALMPPVFALALFLLYGRRRPHYADHFIFALHYWTFASLVQTVSILFIAFAATHHSRWDALVSVPLLIATWGYLLIALRRVYQQSYFISFLKGGVLMVTTWVASTVFLVLVLTLAVLDFG